MKKLYYFLLFFIISSRIAAQDILYTTDGKTLPGKVTEITSEKVKYSAKDYDVNQVLLAVNSAGDYLVLYGARPGDQEKKDFLKSAPAALPSDFIIRIGGDVISGDVVSESADNIVYKTKEAAQTTIKTSEAAAIIRKNGTHKLFVSPEIAIIPLRMAKSSIASLLAEKTSEASGSAPKLNIDVEEIVKSSDLNVDMELFSKKALQKTEEFSAYLQTISAVNTTREKATKSIDMACGLFLNEEARVEVSSTNTTVKNKYKIRDYLNRLQFRSGQYDKIIIEYADINYASEFKKGTDGNYYGVVTFVQKFRGFIDGNVVYGDITKRNLTIVLRQYEKAIDGGFEEGWDVFLADLGVVETKKL